MKRLLLFPLLWLLLGQSGVAGIVLDEPVIEMSGSQPSYIKFVGTNTANNYRYTLDTYKDDGLKFRLTLDRIDASKPAFFTLTDLSDENYWEPLFRRYTKELAGEEMLAAENVKQLYVNDVALLDNQFSGYCDCMKYVEINASGDYNIPDGCFAMGSAEHYGIKQLVVKVGGALTLGNNVVETTAGGLTVYTYRATVAQAWYEYKTNNAAAFTLLFNDASYEGGEVVDEPIISAVNATYTLNGTSTNMIVPNAGSSVTGDEFNNLTSFTLDGFTATTTGPVTEVFMDYAVYPEGHGGNQHTWQQVHAISNGDGTWTASTSVNVLAGLASNTAYTFELSFNTNPGSGERAHYPTDGSHICIKFSTAELPSNFVMDEPVIEMNGSEPQYIKFVGTNATNNYRYTIDTYQDDGLKFRLTLDRIDPSKPAAVTLADLVDANYWEPLFRRYTLQLAGFEMKASNNMKKIYVNDVALLDNQFSGYCDCTKYVEINASGDYTVPSGCFAQGDAENYGIKQLKVKVGGALTLGNVVVEPTAGGLSVYAYDEGQAHQWYDYKQENSAVFTIFLNDAPYVPADPIITAVSASYTLNGLPASMNIPNAGGAVMGNEYNNVSSFVLNSFTATTTGNVTEVFMDYAVYPEADGGNQHAWQQIYATSNGDGTWTANTSTNVLAGLASNTAYVFELSFNTNPGDGVGRGHYPTDGSHIRIHFTTGDVSTGIDSVQAEKGGRVVYDLQGRRVSSVYHGIVIQGGKKVLKL